MIRSGKGLNLQLVLATVGACGPLLFLAAVLVGGAINPGYSHLSDAVSELMQSGAANARPVQVLFSLSAVAMLTISAAMYLSPGGGWRLRTAGWLLAGYASIALLLATVFPMDPIGATATWRGTMHLVLVGVSAALLVAGILVAGHALDHHFGWRWFWPYSIATALAMAAGAIATPLLIATGISLLGLAERATQFAYLQWLLVYAIRTIGESVASNSGAKSAP